MVSKSSYMICQVDTHVMESDNPILVREDFMRMVVRHLKTKMEQTWRVRLHKDGTVAVYSFALPSGQKILGSEGRLNDVSLLPVWIQERLAVLQICEQGDIVDGIGQKVSDNVYYVIE